MAKTTVFQRNEKKFRIHKSRMPELLESLSPCFTPDEFGLHTISSLYYDTVDFFCAHRQIQKLTYREKLRMRCYGTPPGMEDIVYLELKKKVAGISYKRRMPLTFKQAEAYMRKGILPTEQGQIFGEIDWFVKNHRLEPKTIISYDRRAFHHVEDPSLRITFDEHTRWRDYALRLDAGNFGMQLLPEEVVLIEVKSPGALPFWLCRIFSEHGLYTQSFSKYKHTCHRLLHQAEGNLKEAKQHVG